MIFSVGFGIFIFFTVAVLTISICCYAANKTDKEAEVKMKLAEVELHKIALEKGKLKAKGEYVE